YLLDSTSPEALGQCTAQLCGNGGKAPSNLAGTSLLFGDIFAKGDAFDSAMGWYNIGSASAPPGYPFADLFADRTANAAQRIALYRDADPSNDPPLVGLGAQACIICHAR
ncbi:MAG TPA: hypothetical protein VEB21_12005, partial [Terriglobales bacterium]|nr:hypothetical protein [Terriglobales bacterium]